MKKQSVLKSTTAALMAVTFALGAGLVYAHGNETHAKKADAPISTDEHAFGKQGDSKKTTRTITINMTDTMRFGPADITVKEGETIKFVVANKGQMMHEMVIGTMDELKAHGELMKKHPGMEHDEPYMTHVSPGKKEEMVWQFTKAGEFYYACLVPGHFEAGMIGKIKVTKAKS
ncbi:cupredoxin domain-containing protein [Noviherbaspirillum aerium]|uniref:cupredoxin domain-containing protein n=1 Tax=Noviherbaspirillum aerium TaxID=2588497 RepID=UPI001CEF589F|nr:cupredoxin family protein [Noviherbaspirillum aerium]